jgi:Clp amino terminal domain, pathogenicity island component
VFERYTERARRVIFFARYEASQFGSTIIESEHLLLGILREDPNLPDRLDLGSSPQVIADDATARLTVLGKTSTSIDLPLSPACKQILLYSAEEAERLNHRHIGVEHLVLGILREGKCGAAEVLEKHGIALPAMREQVAKDASREDARHVFHSSDATRKIVIDMVSMVVDRLHEALDGASEEFGNFQVAPQEKTPHDLVCRMIDIAIEVRRLIAGLVPSHVPSDFASDVHAFEETLRGLAGELEKLDPFQMVTPYRLSSPLADLMSCIGQITLLRRLSG